MSLATPKIVHTNPVYGAYFADPFVWKTGDTYYAIGTGDQEAKGQTLGKIFPIIQSAERGEDWRWCYIDDTYL